MTSPTADIYSVSAGVRTVRLGEGVPGGQASAITITGPISSSVGSPAAFTLTLNGVVASGFVVTLSAPGATINPSTISYSAGNTAPRSFTVTCPSPGTYSVSMTNTGGLSNIGGPIQLAAVAGLTLPSSGQAITLGYVSGAHPQGLLAMRSDLTPQGKPWNPTPLDVGPWGAGSPGARTYTWASATAYCGAAYSQTEHRWIGYGAGHSAINVPVPYVFDVPSQSWSWLAIPIPSDGLSLASAGTIAATAAAYPSEQWDANLGVWKGGWSGWGALAQPGKVFAEPSHTMYCDLWIPGSAHGNTKGIFMPLNACGGRTAGSDNVNSHYWDLDTNTWQPTVNKRSTRETYAGGAIWFGGSVNRAFCKTAAASSSVNALDVYNPTTKTWTVTNSTASVAIPIQSGGMLAHLPSNLLIICSGVRSDGVVGYPSVSMRFFAVDASVAAAGAHAFQTLNVTASSWPIKPSDGNLDFIGWQFCPLNGCFYAIDGGHNSTTMWKLTPPSGATTTAQHLAGTWTIETVTLTNPIVNGGAQNNNFILNRMMWDDAYGCFVFVGDHIDSRPQAIRPPGV